MVSVRSIPVGRVAVVFQSTGSVREALEVLEVGPGSERTARVMFGECGFGVSGEPLTTGAFALFHEAKFLEVLKSSGSVSELASGLSVTESMARELLRGRPVELYSHFSTDTLVSLGSLGLGVGVFPFGGLTALSIPGIPTPVQLGGELKKLSFVPAHVSYVFFQRRADGVLLARVGECGVRDECDGLSVPRFADHRNSSKEVSKVGFKWSDSLTVVVAWPKLEGSSVNRSVGLYGEGVLNNILAGHAEEAGGFMNVVSRPPGGGLSYLRTDWEELGVELLLPIASRLNSMVRMNPSEASFRELEKHVTINSNLFNG